MVDYVAKPALLANVLWLQVTLLVMFAGTMQYIALKWLENTHRFSDSVCLLFMQLVCVSLFFGLASDFHSILLSFWVLAGSVTLFVKKNRFVNFIPNEFFVEERYPVLALVTLSLLIIVFTSTQVHYDYFHGTIPSIDFALNRSSPSEWLKVFDSTYWPLFTQTLLPAFDAIEIYYSGGKLANLTTFLFLTFLIIAVLSRLKLDAMGFIFVTPILAFYLIDFALTPRSHVIVGFACALLVLADKSQRLAILLGIAALLLAKRDGFAIAFVMLSLVFLYSQFKIFTSQHKWWQWLLMLLFYIALLISSVYVSQQWVVIKGMTISEVVMTMLNLESITVFIRLEVILTIAILASVIFTLIRERTVTYVDLFIMSICLYVLASALALQGLEQYNSGTIIRKLLYMLLPAAFIFFAAKIWQRNNESV